jgi:hypothetical protein
MKTLSIGTDVGGDKPDSVLACNDDSNSTEAATNVPRPLDALPAGK